MNMLENPTKHLTAEEIKAMGDEAAIALVRERKQKEALAQKAVEAAHEKASGGDEDFGFIAGDPSARIAARESRDAQKIAEISANLKNLH